MYRTALALTSAALMLTAPTATAQETEPPPEQFGIEACGSMLTFEELKANFNERGTKRGFAVSGNVVLRISDDDSSIVVRLPGRFSLEFTATGGIATNTGRTLLVPDPNLPFLAEAIAEAGLPELPLIIGRVVTTDTVDPETGELIAAEVTSVKGRVIDVCELLAR